MLNDFYVARTHARARARVCVDMWVYTGRFKKDNAKGKMTEFTEM